MNDTIARELDASTRLAVDRTRVAYERTMLAWVRTATGLITFGFSVSKFSDLLRPGVQKTGYLIGPNQFGLILVCLGLASLALAVLEQRQGIRNLGIAYAGKPRSTAVFLAGLVAALGVLALFAMVIRAWALLPESDVKKSVGAMINGGSTSTITMNQSGNGLVGSNAANGNGFTGAFVTDAQINGKWHGPGGAGWLTVYVTPNGHSFNGTWGYNGRAANGSFVGNKVVPPSPITAAGTWHVTGAGGPTAFVGTMRWSNQGRQCLPRRPILINGKFRATGKVRATWTSPNGSGWFSFWFNNDNNSFNGIWGNGKDTTPPVGRVIGQRSLGG